MVAEELDGGKTQRQLADEMREGEYGGVAVMLPRGDRPELVAQLRGLGLSQQQIGDTLGVSDVQVGRDLRNRQMSDTERPPTRTDAMGRERPTSYQRQPEPESVTDCPGCGEPFTDTTCSCGQPVSLSPGELFDRENGHEPGMTQPPGDEVYDATRQSVSYVSASALVGAYTPGLSARGEP